MIRLIRDISDICAMWKLDTPNPLKPAWHPSTIVQRSRQWAKTLVMSATWDEAVHQEGRTQPAPQQCLLLYLLYRCCDGLKNHLKFHQCSGSVATNVPQKQLDTNEFVQIWSSRIARQLQQFVHLFSNASWEQNLITAAYPQSLPPNLPILTSPLPHVPMSPSPPDYWRANRGHWGQSWRSSIASAKANVVLRRYTSWHLVKKTWFGR